MRAPAEIPPAKRTLVVVDDGTGLARLVAMHVPDGITLETVRMEDFGPLLARRRVWGAIIGWSAAVRLAPQIDALRARGIPLPVIGAAPPNAFSPPTGMDAVRVLLPSEIADSLWPALRATSAQALLTDINAVLSRRLISRPELQQLLLRAITGARLALSVRGAFHGDRKSESVAYKSWRYVVGDRGATLGDALDLLVLLRVVAEPTMRRGGMGHDRLRRICLRHFDETFSTVRLGAWPRAYSIIRRRLVIPLYGVP